MRKKGMQMGGTIAPQGVEFSCKIGDSIETIQKQNTHLTDNELQIAFNLSREQTEQTEQTDEHRYSTEN